MHRSHLRDVSASFNPMPMSVIPGIVDDYDRVCLDYASSFSPVNFQHEKPEIIHLVSLLAARHLPSVASYQLADDKQPATKLSRSFRSP
jgi:hypothetical protein